MEYSPEALGQVIRELREARTPKLSQEELGRKAGYRTGAGVSMSRIENGMTRPGPRRLEGIATAGRGASTRVMAITQKLRRWDSVVTKRSLTKPTKTRNYFSGSVSAHCKGNPRRGCPVYR